MNDSVLISSLKASNTPMAAEAAQRIEALLDLTRKQHDQLTVWTHSALVHHAAFEHIVELAAANEPVVERLDEALDVAKKCLVVCEAMFRRARELR